MDGMLNRNHRGMTAQGVALTAVMVAAIGGLLLAGCVSTEKYEAEKARALNFQRLLAQEEKRTGELNAQVQETKRQVSAIESQNRDLNTELQALRDRLNRAQEELTRMRETKKEDAGLMESKDLTLSEPSLAEFGLTDLGLGEKEFKDLEMTDSQVHIVEKGETLYRISRQYGVTVDDLKRWNNLKGNTISVGQRLAIKGP